MTAVAVWPHRPIPDELLDARVQAGWKPMASPLRDGDRVLGFAACLFETAAFRARVAQPHDGDRESMGSIRRTFDIGTDEP